jgi:hypothetical protein
MRAGATGAGLRGDEGKLCPRSSQDEEPLEPREIVRWNPGNDVVGDPDPAVGLGEEVVELVRRDVDPGQAADPDRHVVEPFQPGPFRKGSELVEAPDRRVVRAKGEILIVGPISRLADQSWE